MLSVHILPLLFLTISFVVLADTNTSIQEKESYIDKKHNFASKQVVHLSENIDTKLNRFLQSFDDNSSSLEDKHQNSEIWQHEQSIDTFYQNKKFSDETDETYISVRLGSYFQSKEPSQYNARVNAQIPLVRSQKKINLFIKNVNQETMNSLTQKENQNTQSSSIIGINYFVPLVSYIKSKYSIATQGLNPLAEASYYLELHAGKWNIEPVQSFKYSRNDKFEEESNIYFDNPIAELSLFRIALHRKTKENIKGMDYALSFQYYYSPQKNTGLGISQSFLGNTDYQYVTEQKMQTYGGINNYVTSLSWRENIWKDWFYYQISPGVSFHKQYDYNPNYILIFLVDIYFGSLLKT